MCGVIWFFWMMCSVGLSVMRLSLGGCAATREGKQGGNSGGLSMGRAGIRWVSTENKL